MATLFFWFGCWIRVIREFISPAGPIGGCHVAIVDGARFIIPSFLLFFYLFFIFKKKKWKNNVINKVVLFVFTFFFAENIFVSGLTSLKIIKKNNVFKLTHPVMLSYEPQPFAISLIYLVFLLMHCMLEPCQTILLCKLSSCFFAASQFHNGSPYCKFFKKKKKKTL